MRLLILMRHGEAAPAGPGGDIDRPLTPRGARTAKAAGAALATRGFAPTIALVSPALRTRETWAQAAQALVGVPMRTDAALLHTGAAKVLRAAEAAGEARVLVVGHNPGLSQLADALSRTGDAEARKAFAAVSFPPGAAAVFVADAQGRLCLQAFLPPAEGEG